MNTNEIQIGAKEDKRRGIRTAIVIHVILIILALLPFFLRSETPSPRTQAVLVEFDMGGSRSGESSSAAAPKDEASFASAESEAEEPTPKPEVQPVEATPTTPVLTSEVEEPIIKQTKIKKVEIKVPTPAQSIPQPTDVKNIPTTKSEPVIRPSKVKKVVIKIERPSTKKSTGKGTGKGSASTGGNTGTASAGGDGGNGSANSGDGSKDGSGSGDKGSGSGDGNGSGKGQGDGEGDGVLMRPIVKTPDLSDIIKESGKLSFNVCVDRSGKVTFIEYNEKHSTIRNKETIRKTLAKAGEYVFERDPTARPRECGRMTFNIEIEL